ncbi:MAG: peptidase [Ignavibacteriae bacterium]|nr:MAG: peptidase [Ignavibacteriota bacterium]
MKLNKVFSIFLLVAIFAIGVFLGLIFNENFSDEDRFQSKKFDEVLTFTNKYYHKETSKEKLVENAIKGMLEELDPHSIYIPPQKQAGIAEQLRGQFDGVGIEYQIIKDTIFVISAIPGGPGEAVGLMPGDRIIKINNKSSIGFSELDVVRNLRGKKGTSVNITVFRKYSNNIIDFKIIRDIVPLNSVETAIMIDDSIGYIILNKFIATSTDEVKNALRYLTERGMKKLILDLRNNPGGYMEQAYEIADLFISDNKLLLFTKNRKNEIAAEYKAEIKYPYENLPLIILVNNGSASSSEILSGAIQDWDRGLIVGETTFGKGLVQRPFTLEDGSVVRLTISKYYTPSGRAIQRDYENNPNYFAIVPAQEKEGNNIEHNLETDSTDNTFFTRGGRKIKANGGITPDYIIKNRELTYYTILLKSKNLFNRFSINYLDRNGKELIQKYANNFSDFQNNFAITRNEMKLFIMFAEANDVVFAKESFNTDKDYIAYKIKSEIAKNLWKNEGFYKILLNYDKQFLKAMELTKQNIKIINGNSKK